MKNLLVWIVLLLPAAHLAAQDREAKARSGGNGHVIAAIGGCQHGVALFGAGGGGEAFIRRGLAIGGDIGAYSFSDTGPFAVATLGASYHFAGRGGSGRVDPFVGAGWAMALGPGGFYGRGFDVGGGLNYWVKDRMGVRLEGRGYVMGEEFVALTRIGVSFR